MLQSFRHHLTAIALMAYALAVQAQVSPPSAFDLRVDESNGLFGLNTYYINTVKTGALQFMMYGQDPTPGAPVGRLRPQSRTLGPSIVCGALAGSVCDVVATSMMMYSAQVLDASPTGRAVMTSSDAAAARMAIGAGTSSFDGSFPSLTGTPSVFAPSPHTHPVIDISDSTATGRAVLTATTVGSARSTLGVYSTSEANAAFYPLSSNPAGYLVTVTNAQTLAAIGFTPYSAANPSAYIGVAGARTAISLTSTGSGAASYNSGTGVLNVPTYTPAARTYTSPARTLNTAYQVSTTQDARVSYSVGVEVAGLISIGAVKSTGVLEYADNAAMTTNVVTVASGKSGAGGVLGLSNSGSINLAGDVPAGKYARIRTTNTGSPTVTLDAVQEVLQ